MLVSAATFGANRLFSGLSCWVENSVCGKSSSSRDNYEGRLLDNALWVILVLFLGAVVLWVAARDAEADDRPATWALRAVVAAGAFHALLLVVLWSAG